MTTLAHERVATLFRHEYGKIVATLTGRLGRCFVDEAESFAQDALVKALQVWPISGIPENPAAWLMTVAWNRARDHLRSQKRRAQLDGLRGAGGRSRSDSFHIQDEVHLPGELNDDLLKMIFACCDPQMKKRDQVALTLKAVCGFGLQELSRALLVEPRTVEQRLTRAKKIFRDSARPFEIPSGTALSDRLGAVCEVLYALFNEGYLSASGDRVVHEVLCFDALRMLELLLDHRELGRPDLYAQAALFCLQSSRLHCRFDEGGDIVLLEDQDRSQWNEDLIRRGFMYLSRSASGQQLSRYHYEAGIAACHAAAPNFASTNWSQIVEHYNGLISICPSPIVSLNRAVAIGMSGGLEEGLRELESLESSDHLKNNHLFHAAKGQLQLRFGGARNAAESFRRAADLCQNAAERRLMCKHLNRSLQEEGL